MERKDGVWSQSTDTPSLGNNLLWGQRADPVNPEGAVNVFKKQTNKPYLGPYALGFWLSKSIKSTILRPFQLSSFTFDYVCCKKMLEKYLRIFCERNECYWKTVTAFIPYFLQIFDYVRGKEISICNE